MHAPHPNGAVVLLSGGADSSVLIHLTARELGRAPVHALTMNYGQRHIRELECARFQAQAARASAHRVVDMAFAADLLKDGTALVEGGREVPDLKSLDPADLDQPPTYVPNRNMMLLSVAAAYAEAQGIPEVYYGAQALDEYGYWDCTQAFLDAMNAVLALNRRTPVQIRAPFIATQKAETLRIGHRLGVDFAQTWSCYRGGHRPCGTCPTCVERAKAFAEAGLIDPAVAT